ncbi:hypothetical protein H6758_00855 [Candidatus Nomurabacteria bacterium]|nr:hypothetical protein [Candidatus Nomurabacteria bacterium]
MKHIHFIGICGVAMSALATAFHKQGYKVTGSDKGFYPPVSDQLTSIGIPYYPGWHVDKMTADDDPDLVVVGNVASSTNPEWTYIQKKGIKYLSYPEALAEFFIKDTSLVVSGTYGKTSTSALLSWTLSKLAADPSYMFGGLVDGIDSAHIGNSDISIMEGDEYKSARWDEKAKFFHYKPTHLVLTALEWDHADIYKTEASYFDAFEQLIQMIPQTGMVVVNKDETKAWKIAQKSKSQVLSFGSADADYVYSNVSQNDQGLRFAIKFGNQNQKIEMPILGDYMLKNITACFAMCHYLGYNPQAIADALQTFPGIKRRLEKRFKGDYTVIDDIAHSPAKARNTLQTLRNIYSGKIIAVFEPNTGNRQPEAIPGYDHAFENADMIVIPRLTKIKIDPHASKEPLDGQRLAEIVQKTHPNVHHIEDDDELVSLLKQEATSGDVIVFLGSHGFRGMIEAMS